MDTTKILLEKGYTEIANGVFIKRVAFQAFVVDLRDKSTFTTIFKRAEYSEQTEDVCNQVIGIWNRLDIDEIESVPFFEYESGMDASACGDYELSLQKDLGIILEALTDESKTVSELVDEVSEAILEKDLQKKKQLLNELEKVAKNLPLLVKLRVLISRDEKTK